MKINKDYFSAGQKVKDVNISRKLRQVEYENRYKETVKNVKQEVIDLDFTNIKDVFLEERHQYISNY